MAELFSICDIVNMIGEDNQPKIDWTKHFDRIYCIHYLPYSNRLPTLRKELDRVGILQSGIFQFKYTYKTIFDSYVRINAHTTCPTFTDINRRDLMTNLILAYYQIFRESIGLGLQKVAVMEDDVVFTNDLYALKVFIEAMPSDWDYIHFDKVLQSGGDFDLSKSKPVNSCYSTYFGGYWGTGFTSFSSKAMNLFCMLTEHDLWPADCVLENRNPDTGLSLNRYVPTTRLVHQFGLDECYIRPCY